MSGRILLADDSQDIRQLARVVFGRAGYEIETVEDGDAALAAARENRPDLIILDIDMPNRDGYSTLVELRGDSRLKDVPVVVLTAMGGNIYEQISSSMGVVEHLQKPFDPQTITDLAARLLGGA